MRLYLRKDQKLLLFGGMHYYLNARIELEPGEEYIIRLHELEDSPLFINERDQTEVPIKGFLGKGYTMESNCSHLKTKIPIFKAVCLK